MRELITIGSQRIMASDFRMGAVTVTLVATQADREIWRVELDVCTEANRRYNGCLMARYGFAWTVGPWLLLPTSGEHSRGASSHEHRLHAIHLEHQGTWYVPGKFATTGLVDGEHLVLARLTARGTDDTPDTTLQLWRFDATGQALGSSILTLKPTLRPDGRVRAVRLVRLRDGTVKALLRCTAPGPSSRWRRWTERFVITLDQDQFIID